MGEKAMIDLTINEKTTGKDYPKSQKERYHYLYICPDIIYGTRS